MENTEVTKTAPGLLPQADSSPALAGLIARLEKAAEDEKTNAEKCHWMKHRSHHMTKRAAFLEAAAMARQCLGS